jgi:hypothetical protein
MGNHNSYSDQQFGENGRLWVWYCAIFLLTPEAIQVFADFFIKGGLPGKSILGNERRK